MTEEERVWHRKFAVSAYNETWDWMERAERTAEENDTMLNLTHASRHHWERVGTAQNLAIGEWQISRVYTLLNRPEAALYHAKRSLEICDKHGITNFALAYAWEAVARAEGLAGRKREAEEGINKARTFGKNLDDETRERLESDLGTISIG